ncbi:hypothetical protein AVDCRST_MAG94-6086 [uncultured Leptolyngbya sp.]|uniref:Uncharacterized protein n=1 Tax=uncultured Leptolyngbya sp. TaxID=332963 RepID=A0A6J4P9D5_9CYAN|nr:hypothetical protein AVDCRST_MAG94-6086 [uncultured Leptolyngbya sp.]
MCQFEGSPKHWQRSLSQQSLWIERLFVGVLFVRRFIETARPLSVFCY